MCERVAIPGGGYAIVCGGHGRSGRKRSRCVWCGKGEATRLCDHRYERVRYPRERSTRHDNKTCSAPVCQVCVVSIGRKDYCPRHAAAHRRERPAPQLPFDEEAQ
jgi:hypothetical protein